MNQEQQQQEPFSAKQGFNIVRMVAAAHATSISMFTHTGMDLQALTARGGMAAVLLFVVAAFSEQPVMLFYLFAFLAAMVFQRIKTAGLLRAGGRIHSQYTGWPWAAMLVA